MRFYNSFFFIFALDLLTKCENNERQNLSIAETNVQIAWVG